MADKANAARDKLKALNATLLQKRTLNTSSQKGGTAQTGLINQLREAQASDAQTTATNSPRGEDDACSVADGDSKVLKREESMLSMLRREQGSKVINPTAPPAINIQETSEVAVGASLLDVLQAGSVTSNNDEEKSATPPSAPLRSRSTTLPAHLSISTYLLLLSRLFRPQNLFPYPPGVPTLD